MQHFDQEFAKTRGIVYAIFASVIPVSAVIAFVRFPESAVPAPGIPLDILLLACGVLTAGTGMIFGRVQLNRERLERSLARTPDAAARERALANAVRNGLLVMAGCGESAALLGLAVWVTTHERTVAWVLVGLGAVACFVTQITLRSARSTAESLLESAPRR